MSAHIRLQQIDPYIRRIWHDPSGEFDRIPDTGLGDWARGRIADAPIELVDDLAAIAAHNEGVLECPVPLTVHRDDATGRVEVTFALAPGERLYGAYDADARTLDRRGDHVHLLGELHPRLQHKFVGTCAMCAADLAALTPAERRALDLHDTKSCYGEMVIPWVISSRGYGVYIANHTSHAMLDLGHGGGDTWSFTAEAGEADIYLFGPASVPDLIRAFTRFTGLPPVPPTWALGFLQSRFGYESFDHAIRAVEGFRERSLPVHGLVFDVQWLEEHVNLRWNPDGFERPEQHLATLAELGVRTIVITEPGTRDDASNFAAGEAIDAYAVDDAGDMFDAPLWFARHTLEGYREITLARSPLVNVFREDVADWWYGQHRPLLAQGVDAWWLDLNEPEHVGHDANFPSIDWPASRDLLDGTHAHNLFAIAQQRAFARRDRLHTDRRPFMLSRCASSGSQRYGASPWSGDIGSTWQAMHVQPHLALTAGMSGIALWGCDVGGFHGDPEPELFARWMQMGAFLPTYRAHGMMHDREPWSQGEEALEAIRPALTLRAQLLPSIATWVRNAMRAGEPLVRPMLWLDDGDARWDDCHDQWFFGPLLVAPVLERGATSRRIELPAGTWVMPFTGERVVGPATIEMPVLADTVPVFVPAGLALVIDPEPLARRAYAWPPSELEVWSFPDEEGVARGELYVDDGITRHHEQGAYCLLDVTVTGSEVEVARVSGGMPAPKLSLSGAHPGLVDEAVPTGDRT